MKWIVALALALALPSHLAVAGNESHGGGGVVLEKFLAGIDAPTVELFDTLEYDKEFMPGELNEYTEFIEPKLRVLKGKLPRTAHYLEKILLRGINPRWYFVKFNLKKAAGVDDHTNLILAFEGVQIALNDGRKVQVQEEFYNGLAPRSRARLLVHEMLRSAIGISYRQSTDVVKSIASLLLHNNLEQFSKEDLANELAKELELCASKGGDLSPLLRLVQGDLTLNRHDIPDWDDQTYLQDGTTPGNCSYETDQCVFRDAVRGILWTKAAPGERNGAALSRDGAEASCKKLKEWANTSDWHLPNFSELQDVAGRLSQLFGRAAGMGSPNGLFWSSSNPFVDPWNVFTESLPGLEGYWGIRLDGGQVRAVRNDSALPWVCVSDPLPQWKMLGRSAEGKLKLGCAPGEQCALLNVRSRILFTAPGPVYKPPYTGKKRPEDVGLVGRAVAQTRCNSLDWLGQKGWRLPTPRVLMTASNEGLYSAALANETFGNLRGEFWVDNAGFVVTPALPIDPIGGPSVGPLGARVGGAQLYGSARYLCVSEPIDSSILKGVSP